MAFDFSGLNTDSALKFLDQYLSLKPYISGEKLTKDDIEVYEIVSKKPGESFPNVSRWYDAVSSQLAQSFPDEAQGVSGEASSAEVAAAKAAAGDDDEYLFDDETKEEKKAAQERKAAEQTAEPCNDHVQSSNNVNFNEI